MRFDPKKASAQPLAAARAESAVLRKRLISLCVLLVLVVVALFAARGQRAEIEGATEVRLPPAAGQPTERVVLPAFDHAAFAQLVSDATPEERVLTDSAALDRLVDHARRLTAMHFDALGVRTLDAAALAEIEASPAAQRAQAFRVRGYVESIAPRERAGRTEHMGTLRLDDGHPVHFVALEVPERTTIDSYLKLDGLFLKLFSVEGDEGWIEAPLIVAPRAVRSWPALQGGGSADDFPADMLATVVDDTVYEVAPPPFEAKWALAAFVRDLEPGVIDWDAAETLDNALMSELLEDGTRFRGRPVRIPVARNQGTWVEDAGENPARIERVTVGWIGSWEWTNKAGVIHFMIPRDLPELQRATSITGRGFFFRNHAYEARDGGLRVAPVFVLESIEPFVAPKLTTLNNLLYGLGGLTAVLAVACWIFLMRDSKRSQVLHEELVRRRRARRARDVDDAATE